MHNSKKKKKRILNSFTSPWISLLVQRSLCQKWKHKTYNATGNLQDLCGGTSYLLPPILWHFPLPPSLACQSAGTHPFNHQILGRELGTPSSPNTSPLLCGLHNDRGQLFSLCPFPASFPWRWRKGATVSPAPSCLIQGGWMTEASIPPHLPSFWRCPASQLVFREVGMAWSQGEGSHLALPPIPDEASRCLFLCRQHDPLKKQTSPFHFVKYPDFFLQTDVCGHVGKYLPSKPSPISWPCQSTGCIVSESNILKYPTNYKPNNPNKWN